MRTKNGQNRAIPWSLVWSFVGMAGVVAAGSVGSGPRRAEAATEVWTAAAASPANVTPPAPATPGVTARSCIACHRFEQVHTHPTNVMATMPVPISLPLAGGLVTCLTCHDASSDHATSRKPVGVRGGPDGPGLCLQCHTNANSNTKAIHAVRTGKAHLTSNSPFDSHAARGGVDGESVGCMACHDGTTASDAGSHAVRGQRGQPSTDHPIGIPMRETSRSRDSDFKLGRHVDKRVRLFDGNLGCGSCHSVYSREPGQLVISNRGSKLCLSCHTQ